MTLDRALADAAIAQPDRRRSPGEPGGAAAVRLDDGRILTGVGLDTIHPSVALCQETGAYCQAYTLDRRVTATVCVFRDPEDGRYVILPPCGVCQERLALRSPDVEVGVPHPEDPRLRVARRLGEPNPRCWARHCAGGSWPSPPCMRTERTTDLVAEGPPCAHSPCQADGRGGRDVRVPVGFSRRGPVRLPMAA
ncbi:cytidine deaminase [Streptomyces omiyaensis]|uniref:Cytidine deaminase n=1 Tax=Streptomyces omiyaensis TaxID=68247 RepID=A0ABW7BP14_9ACTN